MTNHELVSKLKTLRTAELSYVVESLLLFNEVFTRKLDLAMGYSSLYEFAAKEIGFEKDEAYRRIRAAEVLRFAPGFKEELLANRVSMTSLLRAQIAFRSEDTRRRKSKEAKLTREEKCEILNAIVKNSSRDAKRVLVEKFPHLEKSEERARPLKGGRVLVQIVMTEEEYAELQRLRGLVAHANPENRLGAVVAKATHESLQRHEKTDDKPFAPPRKGRVNQPPRTKRAVHKAAGYQCQYVSPEGKRCQSQHALQVDHVVPLACGGTNEISNLRILCGQHNRFSAWKMGLRNLAELRAQH